MVTALFLALILVFAILIGGIAVIVLCTGPSSKVENTCTDILAVCIVIIVFASIALYYKLEKVEKEKRWVCSFSSQQF